MFFKSAWQARLRRSTFTTALLLAPLAHGAEKVVIKNGWQLELPERQVTLSVEPLETYSATETVDLSKAQPLSWKSEFDGVGLKLSRPGETFTDLVYRALVPGSVKVSGQGREYQPEVDFLVDVDWGRVGRSPNSAIPEGATVTVEYRYTYARVDLVELSAEGKVVLKKGETMRGQALPPQGDPRATPLFTVYLSHGTTELSEKQILMVDPTITAQTPVLGPERLEKFRQLLDTGKPVKIVCIGDSITEGGGAGANSYVERLKRYFKARSGDQVNIINSGKGGNTSGQGLQRFDQDVLAHQPDLVIIMFGVNDENAYTQNGNGETVPKFNGTSVKQYRDNLTEMIGRIRSKSAADIILMTPSWKNPGWVHTGGNLNEYADAVRALGEEHQLCVVDSFTAWANLEKRGIPFLSLLNSGINHPSGDAHEIFLNGLEQAFEYQTEAK
jgi:lysophospholipase L1-like esterase